MAQENLTGYVENLSTDDLHFICWALNKAGSPTNLGQVVFVAKVAVLEVLVKAQESAGNHAAKNKARKLQKLLYQNEDVGVSFEMFLNEQNIFKYTRHNKSNNCFEIILPDSIERLVGLKWEEFKKEYVQVKTYVRIILTMKRLGKNRFLCTVHESRVEKTKRFLFERYGINRVFPKGL